jgi:hypothetical protein
MLLLLKNKKAQNTMEYAILFAVVVGALTAMQLYVRRSLQQKIRGGTDNMANAVIGQEIAEGSAIGQDLLGNPAVTQYEPYYYVNGVSDLTSTTSEGTEQGTIQNAGGLRDLRGATTQQGGYQTVAPPQ